jgi:two-component system KDP operon response regulator KdpE
VEWDWGFDLPRDRLLTAGARAERIPEGGTAFRFTCRWKTRLGARGSDGAVMAGRATILVEDEPEIRRFLRSSLGAEGYRVVESASGRRGSIDAQTHKPGMAIVDWGFPTDGTEVIRHIRSWSAMPISVLSARTRNRKWRARRGRRRHVTKPFGVGELLARVRAALRHAVRGGSGGTVLEFEAATVNLARRRATRDGAEIRLTPIEYRLLACLAKHSGMVVTQHHLLAEVWGPTHVEDTHYLRIYMKQLREKLERDPVQPRHLITETGVGYRLMLDD